jgi:hypothetical protein
MIKTKKTPAEKELIKFSNRLHNLLIKHPDIRLAGDRDGNPIAIIHSGDRFSCYEQIHLPAIGQQEQINK